MAEHGGRGEDRLPLDTRQRWRVGVRFIWRCSACWRRPSCVTSRSAALRTSAIWGSAGSSTALALAASLSTRRSTERASLSSAVVRLVSASRRVGSGTCWSIALDHAGDRLIVNASIPTTWLIALRVTPTWRCSSQGRPSGLPVPSRQSKPSTKSPPRTEGF